MPNEHPLNDVGEKIRIRLIVTNSKRQIESASEVIKIFSTSSV